MKFLINTILVIATGGAWGVVLLVFWLLRKD